MDFYLNKTEKIVTALCCIFIVAIPQYGVMAAFIILAIYIRRYRKNEAFIHSLGFKKPENSLKIILFGLLSGVLIELVFEILVNPLIESKTQSKIDLSEFYYLKGNLSAYLMWMLVGWILGGFLEEVLFRGFLFTRISGFFGNTLTIEFIGAIIIAVLFGTCHLYQGTAGMISTGLIGLIFCLIFIFSKRNLWYCIATHGFVNMTGFTILYLGKYAYFNTLLFK